MLSESTFLIRHCWFVLDQLVLDSRLSKPSGGVGKMIVYMGHQQANSRAGLLNLGLTTFFLIFIVI